MTSTPRLLRRCVLPVGDPRGPIGTATVVGEGLALTALHVVAPEEPAQLRVGPNLLVHGITTLRLRDYQSNEDRACRSQRRAHELLWESTDHISDTVDLALLAVPRLHAPPLVPRTSPVAVGEYVMVPGYPNGRWSITRGPVTGVDDADFTARLLLGPGASGAPALDDRGRLVGVVTIDHEAGTICIGPALVTAFLDGMREHNMQVDPSKP